MGTTQFAADPIIGRPDNRPLRLLYSFTNAASASPTPEPGTLILVASGAALAMRNRRRRSAV
ncbi:MAG: hypothetical protein DMF86_20310 [Acidobacteria bacterium]|nr:MAG: hypothetical protein DMF86_20310 [Acidobacteriota bacterium]